MLLVTVAAGRRCDKTQELIKTWRIRCGFFPPYHTSSPTAAREIFTKRQMPTLLLPAELVLDQSQGLSILGHRIQNQGSAKLLVFEDEKKATSDQETKGSRREWSYCQDLCNLQKLRYGC